jgi:hypothetical protein
MNYRLCLKFGLVDGAAVGLILSLLRALAWEGGPPPMAPTLLQLAADGLLVSLIVTVAAVAFACLIRGRDFGLMIALGLLIGVIAGLLLGPVGYHIANPGVALVVCAILGALLGWLICRLICGPRKVPVGFRP